MVLYERDGSHLAIVEKGKVSFTILEVPDADPSIRLFGLKGLFAGPRTSLVVHP